MGYEAKILKDSITSEGNRLTTFEITFPRFVLAEFNTHRALSRSSASSRAIPVEKRIAMVDSDPFIPESFGKNQKGMQASEELDDMDAMHARRKWIAASGAAVFHAGELAKIGVHKQLANRLLEPFLWHTVIVSATEWSNFFALRCHPDAQPEIRKIVMMMRDLRTERAPEFVPYKGIHRPMVSPSEVSDLHDAKFSEDEIDLVSVGRCARVSYLTHDGKRDPRADVELAQKLSKAGHMSPFEHVAEAHHTSARIGNFVGWKQLRKFIPNEHDFSLVLEDLDGGKTKNS